jgi:hypothetical protein
MTFVGNKSQTGETEMNDPCVLVIGNLAEGFRFIGPFADFDEASEYSLQFGNGSWDWIATIESPEAAKKGGE